jgi:malic enzyme
MTSDRAVPGTADDELALERHRACRGKIQTVAKCPMTSHADLAVWYTPGVAAPSQAIHANPALAYDYTNKANTVAIVTDGSRVLGLGNIGPLAALPVMEGIALTCCLCADLGKPTANPPQRQSQLSRLRVEPSAGRRAYQPEHKTS